MRGERGCGREVHDDLDAGGRGRVREGRGRRREEGERERGGKREKRERRGHEDLDAEARQGGCSPRVGHGAGPRLRPTHPTI